MYVVPETALLDLQQAIVEATHGITDERGQRALLSTIDTQRLQMAALVGLQVAVGDVIWPSNRKIILPRRRELPGPFIEEQ